MWARWTTLGLWALVAASAVAWGLKLFVRAPAAPPEARVVDATQALRGDLSRVLGADAVAPAAAASAAPVADARFQLLGVLAPRSTDARRGAREGVALIAVDGKPPKAYRVGAAIEEGTVLKSVRARGAELGPRDGAPTIALEIAPPPPAATGVLPPAGGAAANPPARGVRGGPLPPPVPPPVPRPPQNVPQAQPVPPPGFNPPALATPPGHPATGAPAVPGVPQGENAGDQLSRI